jgi:hypothetical protein
MMRIMGVRESDSTLVNRSTSEVLYENIDHHL